MRRVSIVLVSLVLVAGCGTSPGDGTPGSAPAPGAVPGLAPAPGASVPVAVAGKPAVESRHAAADVTFVRALIPHHEQGIALARQVAKTPGARTLAEAIIVTQQDEIVRMTAWLAAWNEAAPPSSSAAPPAGDPIDALIAHQLGAVELAQAEQANGTNPSALAFARQVIESRTGQIDQLRTER
jgi:uncharacterized protein (DUF305 family)